MKTINETFSEEDYKILKEKKGKRTWKEAILYFFGIIKEEKNNE